MKSSSVEHSFESCVRKYFEQWIEHERSLHMALSSNVQVEGVRKALSYFKVSRTFKGLADEEAGNQICSRLEQAVQMDVSPAEKVVALAKFFEEDGFNFNVSAASKLVWLAEKSSIIFDTRAVKALSHICGRKYHARQYLEYCKHWDIAYSENHPEIALACEGFLDSHESVPADTPTDMQPKELMHADWFRRRIFDIWLWKHGG